MATINQELESRIQQKALEAPAPIKENAQNPSLAPAAALLTTLSPTIKAAQANATQPSDNNNQVENNFNNAVKQWEQAGVNIELEKGWIKQIIAKLEALVKAHDIQGAWNVMLFELLPQTQKYRNLVLSQLAATMNVSSALQAMISTVQSDTNAGKNITVAQANQLKTLLIFMHDQLEKGEKAGWIGANTAQNMLSSIGQIYQMFGGNFGKNGMHGLEPTNAHIQTLMIKWFSEGKFDQVQKLQAGMTQLNNTNASHSQDLQTLAQGQTNEITQMLNTMAAILKADLQQEGSFVHNQRTS